jgi:hypothetical protein
LFEGEGSHIAPALPNQTAGRTYFKRFDMTTSDWLLTLNGVAIVLAPIVALWIAGKLQRRSDSYKAKLDILSTLMGLRHDPLSADSFRALNLIDAVFANDSAVREAWTRYLTALNDASLNVGPGFAIREEKRRDLLLEIVKALGLRRKISSAELLRGYLPAYAADLQYLAFLERMYKRALFEEELKRRGIPIPAWAPTPQEGTPVSPSPAAGNGGKPVASQPTAQDPAPVVPSSPPPTSLPAAANGERAAGR